MLLDRTHLFNITLSSQWAIVSPNEQDSQAIEWNGDLTHKEVTKFSFNFE